MREEIDFEALIPALKSVARRVGAEQDEGLSVGWLVTQRACRHGRGPGWIVEATRRILARQVAPCAGLDLTHELAEVLPAARETDIERWRREALPPDLESVLQGGTAGLAARLGVTRRRAQQLVAGMTNRLQQGDLFGLGG